MIMTESRSKAALFAAVIALVAVVGACTKDIIPLEPGGVPIIGDFTLVSVDGAPLPVVTAQDADSVAHLVAGSFSMGEDYSFEEIYVVTLSREGVVQKTTSETYEGVYRNETVRILFGGTGTRAGDRFEGSMKGDTLVLIQSASFYRFVKQGGSGSEGS
jgi:hypothetical protein